MKTLGNRLKELRMERDLSIAELADKFGVSLSVFSRYENDIVVPKLDLIIALARFFNVSVDYLTGYSDDKGDNNSKVLNVNNKIWDHLIKLGLVDPNKELTETEVAEIQEKLSQAIKVMKALEE